MQRAAILRLLLSLAVAAAVLGAAGCAPPAENNAGANTAAENGVQNDADTGETENDAENADDAEDDAEAMAGDVAHGEELFQATCASCHGMDATGIEGLGKDLHDNEWVQEQSDDELVTFFKEGRPASHELNTTGVDMPPKGGNPALSDEDLVDIAAYVRSLQ